MDCVSAYLAEVNALPKELPKGLPKAQIDVIWEMGVASLAANNDELVIPQYMAVKLSPDNITDLKNRLSAHFDNVFTAGFFDRSSRVLRIGRAADLPFMAESQASMSSPGSGCATPQSQMSTSSLAELDGTVTVGSSGKKTAKKLRQCETKSKVTRPPNAFILYRTHYHAILIGQRPDLANNEISVLLGKQWRSEPGEVRDHWKAQANQVKIQHAAENPGYQYAPRKPSEKKRRMTARKLAKLRAQQAANDSQSNSDSDMMDVTSLAAAISETTLPVQRPHEVAMFYENNAPISTTGLLMNERASAYPSRLKKNFTTDEFNITFPAGHDNVERDYNIRASRYQNRDASEVISLSNTNYSEVRAMMPYSTDADDDFMNDLVDWNIIEDDAKAVHNAVNSSNLEVLEFDNEAEQAQFQEDITRAITMFE